jgi:hypothetical protein
VVLWLACSPCIEYTSPLTVFEPITLVVIGTDCKDSDKPNYHTITRQHLQVFCLTGLGLEPMKIIRKYSTSNIVNTDRIQKQAINEIFFENCVKHHKPTTNRESFKTHVFITQRHMSLLHKDTCFYYTKTHVSITQRHMSCTRDMRLCVIETCVFV